MIKLVSPEGRAQRTGREDIVARSRSFWPDLYQDSALKRIRIVMINLMRPIRLTNWPHLSPTAMVTHEEVVGGCAAIHPHCV